MKSWLLRVRNSGRVAFLLRLSVMFPSMLLSLWWARALVHVMGPNNYGLFMAFQGVMSLMNLGDLGMGGALLVRTSRLLANNQTEELHQLHSSARMLFLGLSSFGLILILLFSPWLPALFHFVQTPASGSLSTLFVVGAFCAFFGLLTSYYQTTLYAVGTVSWTVLPPILIFHLGSAFQLLCAFYHGPLWLQMVPSLVLAIGCLLLYRKMVRVTHPDLAGPFPLEFTPSLVRALLHSSFWAYLISISYCLYVTIDRLMVNAGFGASQVTPYLLNFKLCDITLAIITNIGFVALPEIISKVLSPDKNQKLKGFSETKKLGGIQTFAACAASMFYLALNDTFIRWWFGANVVVPLDLQLAFAFTLLLMGSSESAVQIWVRLSESSLQKAALATALSALVNLELSYVGMSIGWIPGIAWATWVARAVFALIAIRAVSAEFQISSLTWMRNVFLTPSALLLTSFFLVRWISPHTPIQWLILIGGDSVLLLLSFFLCGLRPGLFHEEINKFRKLLMIKKGS